MAKSKKVFTKSGGKTVAKELAAGGRLRRWLGAPFRATARLCGATWQWIRVKVFRREPKVAGRKKPVLVASKRQAQKKKDERRARLKRVALSALKITALVVLIGAALVMFFERRMIFPSQRWPEGRWDEAERELDGRVDVEITTEDKTKLHGWWVPHDTAGGRRPKPLATILFFHGNAGNLSHRASWLAWLRQNGYQTFCVDYRGYGRSEGSPSERGIERDAVAAYDWLCKADVPFKPPVPPEQVVLMGRSLGAAVAVELATDAVRPVAALVLEAPFMSIGEMSKEVLPAVIPVRWFLATKLDNMAKVPHLKQPLLLIHGTADADVPVEHGRAVFAAAGNTPKQIYEVPGGTHNAANWERKEYRERFTQFVAKHTARKE